MIRDGKLAYGATPSPLKDFEFENTVLNTFIIALFTTILSYQAASLAFDLLLGFKSSNQARVSDIHILLLTRESSPLAVCASVLRLDWLTRKKFRGDLQQDTSIERDVNHVRACVVWKLVSLLALVPFLNICSIVLSFSRAKTISFGEARFGGAYLDINADLSVLKLEPFTRNCEVAAIELATNDRTNVTFYLCQRFPIALRNISEDLEGSATVALRMVPLSVAVLQVRVGRSIGYSHKFAEVSINESVPFRLRSTISPATAKTLVDFGIDLLVRQCRSENPTILEMRNDSTVGNMHMGGKVIVCSDFADDESRLLDRVLIQLTNLITLVEADVFELMNFAVTADGALDDSIPEFFRADDYPFLLRTRPYLSLPMLVVTTVVVLLVRMGLKLLLNNDVAEGVLRLVKKGIGFHYWESLLRTAQVVQYYPSDDHSVTNREESDKTACEVSPLHEQKCIQNGLTGT